jgi:peptidoglycan hydrolase-like protein with peptidoglycan-binding domain
MRRILIVLLVVVASACGPADMSTGPPPSGGSGSTAEHAGTTMPAPPPITPTAAPTTTTSTTATTATTTTTVPPPPEPDVLQAGAEGPEVRALQVRLDGLGYWLGAVDGAYGSSTVHAVTAFQKASGIARDGAAGPQTLDALARATRPVPRSASGHVIEVDLPRQLVVVADDGYATWVFDSSTGVIPGTTPRGSYAIFRQVDGMDTGPYGPLYRPKYFVGGVALHGYPSVPPRPASHGCVRVTNEAINLLWNTGTIPIGTDVLVY